MLCFNVKVNEVMNIDFSKAFDSVNQPILLRKLLNFPFHSKWIQCLFTHLRGRKAACLYLSAADHYKLINSSVPRGSFISSCNSNFFISDCFKTPQMFSSYVEDVTIAITYLHISPDATTISTLLYKSVAPRSD